MDLPVNVSTGMVVGRYIADVIDGPDANLDPDAQPVQGRIVFTASVPYLPNPTASPDPVTIMRAPIVGVLDADGYLCTPYPGTLEPQYRGVRLIATDDPDIAVTDWTWDVTYLFEPINGHKLAIPAHGFALPSGEAIDLTKVAKVPSSPGYSLPQAEAAVLRAEAIAQSIRDDADAGLFNGEAATLEIGAVSSGASAEVVNVGDEQHAILNITLEKGDKGDTGTGVPDAGASLQVMRMDSDGIGTEWATPTKAIVGLTNVDNTSDVDKPVSSATQTALEAKASIVQLDAKADRRLADVLYTDTSGYIFIVDQSTTAGSTLRYEDTPDHDGSILRIAHRGGAVGTGQAYGINLANYPEAKGGFIGHQYSKKSPFLQIDNTDINAAIYIRNTPNTTQNPGGVQTGDFFQLKPGSEASNRLILKDNLTFWNQTSLDFKVQADNATNYAFGVQTSKDIRALVVTKSGTGAGSAVEVNNAGTQPGIWVKQTGSGNAIYVEGNKPEQFGKAVARFLGNTHGAQFDINADGGSGLLINKTSTGFGDAVRIINPGTGPSIDFRNAGGAVAQVNPNGEYEHLTAGAGIILKSPNGTRYRATITDAGELVLSAA